MVRLHPLETSLNLTKHTANHSAESAKKHRLELSPPPPSDLQRLRVAGLACPARPEAAVADFKGEATL